MGHSYVDYRGQSLHLRDGQITMVVACVLDVRRGLDSSTHVPANVDLLLEWWDRMWRESPVGCMVPKLDEHLQSPEDVRFLVFLLDRAEMKLRAFGEIVPGEYFNDLLQSEMIKFGDRPIADVLQIFDKFRSLLCLDAGGARYAAGRSGRCGEVGRLGSGSLYLKAG